MASRVRRFAIDPIIQFLRTEVAGGVVLLAAAAVALVWANSPLRESYEAFWATPLDLRFGTPLHLDLSLRLWVNELLMAFFFFVVGLEIKRELVDGELKEPRNAALPVVAAAGGMAAPAAIYLWLNAGGPGAAGWGIPMATDIAFAVGVLALFGRSVPVGLKIFLLSVAIVDDIGAIAVIAIFYTGGIVIPALGVGFAGLMLTLFAWPLRLRERRPFVAARPFAALMGVLALVVWVATHESGVHATLAGVALGLATPATPGRQPSPAERLEEALHPWTSFVVVPLFAVANAGVPLGGDVLDALRSPIGLGIVLGLVAGKIFGISASAWLACRLRLARLPRGVTMAHVVAASAVAGIGFTVSIFIAGLAFADEELVTDAKLGILTGSLVAALIGSALLALLGRRRDRENDVVAAEAERAR
ncbi:MAG TPA: Na+/H+ antiporter NhaA [Candidatus Limnocylindrales bacterium]|nr:Na+/H+ antiporter NhaA [Candidatus Limnocylindrales bacterium]